MKPAPFEHVAPTTLEEALALLDRHGEAARVLAGGQSLIPSMAYRMARPELLVDINRVAGLDHVTVEGGRLRLGALVRHARLERPLVPGPTGALLAEVARHVAHPPIRHRGTFCGSLAHADPAAEWCAVALALDARLVVQGLRHGRREVAATDWFQGVFATALRPGEMLVEASLPVLDGAWRCGFAEFSRRLGDFAMAMAVVALRLDGGCVAEARVALGGIGGQPFLSDEAAAALRGQPPGYPGFAVAADAAARACDPPEDVLAPPEYRRELVAAMVRRALVQATGA